MTASLKFPLTNEELYALGQGDAVRFPAGRDEFWALLEKAEYRVDYHNREIIASMRYESESHSMLTTRLSFLLQGLFWNDPSYKVHNSNRPVCIPGCDFAVFNPDGCVTAQPAQLYEYRPGMNAELLPVLLFEVLSNSTRAYDFGEKLPCYKKIPTLRQILYLETERPEVTVFDRLEDTGQWLETNLKKPDDVFRANGQVIALRDIYGAQP